MVRYICNQCDREGNTEVMGVCMREHESMVKKVIDTEDGVPIYLNKTGEPIKFSNIDSASSNKLITFKAKVISISDILSYDISREYKCPECMHVRTIKCNDYREFPEFKMMCDACSKAFLILNKSETVNGNLRKVILQETMDDMSKNPRRIEAEIVSNFVFESEPGKDYEFEAELWMRKLKGNANENRLVLSVTQLRCLDEDTAIMPTDEEIKRFNAMDMKNVINSLAPQIKYRMKEKLGAIIMMLSGGKVDNIRGDLSVLFCGDPSTGKTQIIEACVGLDNKSQKVSGRSTSAAGLVMGVDNLPDGTRMATFGPVVLCHKHFVAIDEGDKMNPNDRSALHDVMESQKAYLNKVGINLTANAETKIIMACNPKSSRYDKEGTIKANIGMPDSFLARFGYIFLFLDNFPQEQERESIRHINNIKEKGLSQVIQDLNYLTEQELTKYINYAKSFNPIMTQEATGKLEDLYIKLRYMKQAEGSLTIDKRSYHDIIRSAYSFARFRFSEKVEVEDINNAWQLKIYSFETFGMKTQGDFNQSVFAPTRDTKRTEFIDTALGESKNDNNMISFERFAIKLEGNKKYCKGLDDAKAIIQELVNDGRLLNSGTEGVYKFVG